MSLNPATHVSNDCGQILFESNNSTAWKTFRSALGKKDFWIHVAKVVACVAAVALSFLITFIVLKDLGQKFQDIGTGRLYDFRINGILIDRRPFTGLDFAGDAVALGIGSITLIALSTFFLVKETTECYQFLKNEYRIHSQL